MRAVTVRNLTNVEEVVFKELQLNLGFADKAVRGCITDSSMKIIYTSHSYHEGAGGLVPGWVKDVVKDERRRGDSELKVIFDLESYLYARANKTSDKKYLDHRYAHQISMNA